jgi:enoyl-CoA hydratase/carnithine racemase
MNSFEGKHISWSHAGGVAELALHRKPLNELGSETLVEMERFLETLSSAGGAVAALIVHSTLKEGFSAGADLRELYARMQQAQGADWLARERAFLERTHRVMNAIDALPITTIAAVHGVCFGGGFEMALACDLIIADRTTRFCFPELRLGLIPGFGGIPRLKRDLGNAVVRDILLTGRSINATKAQAVGLVSQVVGEGEALRLARITAAQIAKFDGATSAAAKSFIKPVPHEELAREIEIFCSLLGRPVVQKALRKFVESTDALPYLP